MSGSHYNHGASRHPQGHGGIRVRTTHAQAPDLFSAERVGMSFAEARSGEQVQTHDIGPGAVDGAVHILGGSIDLDLFVQGIRPPHVVAALPSLPDEDYPEGDYAFLTTTSELYVNQAEAWVLEDGSTITNGTMVAGLVRAGAIATEQLAADAVIANVANVGGTVLIDDTGITISDGALTIQDYAGRSVVTSAGFEGGWRSYISSGGVLNALMDGGAASGTTLTTTEVGGADTAAEYRSSLSDDLPYWVVDTSNATSLPLRVWDSLTSPSGRVVGVAAGPGAAGWASIYQDIPVAGYDQALTVTLRVSEHASDTYVPWSLGIVTLLSCAYLRLEFAFTYDSGTSQVTLDVYISHRNADHALVSGSRTLAGSLVFPGTPASLFIGSVDILTHQHIGEIRGPGLDTERGKLWLRDSTPEFYMYGGLEITKDLIVDGGQVTINYEDGEDSLLDMYVPDGGVYAGYLRLFRGAETQQRLALSIAANGRPQISFGPGGSTAPDVILVREEANALRLYGKLLADGETWNAPTFTNSWVNFGGTLGTVGYRRDANGFVHLKGVMKSGTMGATAFTLPVGYRPGGDCRFSAYSNNAWGSCNVSSAGAVVPNFGSNASFALDGITFRADG